MKQHLKTLDLTASTKKTISTCKGIICRAYVYVGRTERGVTHTIRLNKLKRKSCRGCECCRPIEDDLSNVDAHWPIEGMLDVKNGMLYRIVMTNCFIDSETGCCDEWNLKAIPHEE